MDNVVPFRGRGRRGRNHHPAKEPENALLTCECGNVWFHAVITFQVLENGRHRPHAYQMSDDENKANVMCMKCQRRWIVH